MNKTTYRRGVPGVKWGIYDKVNNCFVSGISEDSPMLAEARLFFIIGDAAKTQRYEPRMLSNKGNGGHQNGQKKNVRRLKSLGDALSLLLHCRLR